jgi:hypothetical protein
VRYFNRIFNIAEMTYRPFFIILFIALTFSCYGQRRMNNPQICHDPKNYLKCYNDGTYHISFGNGNFKEIKTDSTFIYSDIEKTFTFYRKSLTSTLIDTLKIKQFPHSVLLINGTEQFEITDLSNISSRIKDFGLGTYTVDGVVRGLSFNVGEKFFKIEIWTYGKIWQWSFIMKQFNQRLTIQYNGYRNNRIESIIIQDDDLKYGIAISMTFRTLKKIKRFISFYAALEDRTSATSYSIIPLDKSYKYEYNKSGKIIPAKVIGNFQICNCE